MTVPGFVEAGMDDYANNTRDVRSTPHAVTASSTFDRWLLNRLALLVGKPQIKLELWDSYVIGDGACSLIFHDRAALYRIFHKPTYTFGLLYAQARVSVRGDLTTALALIYEGMARAYRDQSATARALQALVSRAPRKNSLRGSRQNIEAHYDLGNEFYALWLDEAYRQYTCAYFADSAYSLEQAQVAKMEYVCRKLNLQPGETVVEAGSGWGGLSRYMARQYGVKVRSYNISSSQVALAREQASRENLHGAVEYVEDDYRNIEGSYDVFVSVGMLEHVGINNFDALGTTLERCLKNDGRGLVHSIGQASPGPLNEWIERFIFPSAQPPSLAQMMDIFEPHEFIVADVENLGVHYAQTLELWRARFDAHVEEVQDMFDEEFVRIWRLYLCGSAAAFRVSNLQLFQVLFRHRGCQTLPDTRAALYAPGLVSA